MIVAVMETQTNAGSRLRIYINGEPRETRASNLAELIAEAGHSGLKIATAVNGDFVPERARADRALAEGDRIEIVSPRQGG